MVVTESGIVIDCNDLQSQKALMPILVTESGMVKVSSSKRYEISFLPSEVYRLPSKRAKCLELFIILAGQLANGFPMMLLTELGIVMDCKDKHPQNALSPMLVTELGMVTDCNDEHPSNELEPMLVTESGIMTDCKDKQSLNAL